MGRKSVLTDAQWEKVDRRLLEGEPARAIARDLDVSESIIRARKKTRVEKIKDAANQVVAADRAVKSLDLPAQRIALTFAQKLQAMTDALAEAGMVGAQNAADLKHMGRAALAEAKAALDRGDLGEAAQGLARMKELGGMANEESEISVRLATAQKEAVRRSQEVPPADAPDLSILSEEELAGLERTLGKVGTALPAPE